MSGRRDAMRKRIFELIKDSVKDLLYYDRKDDENLSRDDMDLALETGVVTVDEMTAVFRNALEHGGWPPVSAADYRRRPTRRRSRR